MRSLRLLGFFLVLFFVTLPCYGQVATPAPASQVFNVTSMAASLPGNKSTVVANISEASFAVHPYLDLKASSLMFASNTGAAVDGAWGGGGNINIPAFSSWLNNTSPTINGFQLKLTLPFSLLDEKVTDSLGNVKYHLGGTFGIRPYYSLDKGQNYKLAGGVEYSTLPQHRGFIYYLGFAVHI